MDAFDAPAMEAPAILPAALVEAALAARRILAPGGEPAPVVVLLEIEVRGGSV